MMRVLKTWSAEMGNEILIGKLFGNFNQFLPLLYTIEEWSLIILS